MNDKTRMEAMEQALRAALSRCQHDGGFDRENGPIGCMLVATGRPCECQAAASVLTPREGDGEAVAWALTTEGRPQLWQLYKSRKAAEDCAETSELRGQGGLPAVPLFAHSALSAEGALTCDVMLPPRTTIRKGCQISTLMTALRAREDWPEDQTRFESPAPQADGWEPIETAPVNRAILVCMPNQDYYGNEGVYAGMLVDMGTGRRWMTFGWAVGRDVGDENAPTAWRPLPAAPSPQSGGE